ncbi:hypothetical protein NLG97_g7371 [Lecanicillium saksenae]|uniref:Uncharacterized protein n=1 Tax=Lecanicillium saksenae TaxID=468837 RepID=A0ACC1QNN8_9HYPO|nr:hypothetical protein NLG97_g7371 [Lecanicillium saksenae]
MFKTRYVTPRQTFQAFTNCLKRHYSYECKATAQERPYVSRPSRTQQLRNPKLVPKLTNDAPNPLEKKKGAADEELMKKEAERERKRGLDERDDESDEASRRPRSPSVDSVSTVSTNSRAGSASPPRRTQDRYGSESGEEAGEISEKSPPRRQRSRSRSPRRGKDERGERRASPQESERRRRDGERRRRSRSPRERGHRESRHRGHRGHRDNHQERRHDAPRSEARERSLSPFSQRLAMTREMKR